MREFYDSSIRQSECGRRLYETWKRARRAGCEADFDSYPNFYKWSMTAGYVIGDKLRRYDDTLPYGPENCYWFSTAEDEMAAAWIVDWCEKWNKTVNRLRRYFGLPEF